MQEGTTALNQVFKNTTYSLIPHILFSAEFESNWLCLFCHADLYSREQSNWQLGSLFQDFDLHPTQKKGQPWAGSSYIQ